MSSHLPLRQTTPNPVARPRSTDLPWVSNQIPRPPHKDQTMNGTAEAGHRQGCPTEETQREKQEIGKPCRHLAPLSLPNLAELTSGPVPLPKPPPHKIGNKRKGNYHMSLCQKAPSYVATTGKRFQWQAVHRSQTPLCAQTPHPAKTEQSTSRDSRKALPQILRDKCSWHGPSTMDGT